MGSCDAYWRGRTKLCWRKQHPKEEGLAVPVAPRRYARATESSAASAAAVATLCCCRQPCFFYMPASSVVLLCSTLPVSPTSKIVAQVQLRHCGRPPGEDRQLQRRASLAVPRARQAPQDRDAQGEGDALRHRPQLRRDGVRAAVSHSWLRLAECSARLFGELSGRKLRFGRSWLVVLSINVYVV